MSPWLHWSLWQCSGRLRYTPVLEKLIMFYASAARSTLLNIPFTLDWMLCFRTDCLHWEENNLGAFSPSGMWERIYTPAIPLINVWKWFAGKILVVPGRANLVWPPDRSLVSLPCAFPPAQWLMTGRSSLADVPLVCKGTAAVSTLLSDRH